MTKWLVCLLILPCTLFVAPVHADPANKLANADLPAGAAQGPSVHDGPGALALKRLVTADPEVKRLLVASIEKARLVNPDPNTNPAQTLEQYFDFVAWVEHALPASLLAAPANATLYQRIDQSLAYLYFVCDQPLEALEGRGYLFNSLQYVESYNAWLKGFVRSWGKFLDTRESWNAEYLGLAQADEGFGLSRGWYETPLRWTTFNQFFARRLKSPEQRPIAAPDDESLVVSPVDGTPQGVWAIDEHSRIVEKSGVPVKTGTVTSVEQLLGEHSRYKSAFAGGTFTHVFLDVYDYHRYHFPLGGVVREVTIIPGRELSGGRVTWDAVNRRYAFDPSSVSYQVLETRATVILETGEHGLVAIMPIGMSPVSSVSIEPAIKEGVRVRKGDLLGNFLFGGSDFVLLFQAGSGFALESPPREPRQGYAHLLMGQPLGRMRSD